MEYASHQPVTQDAQAELMAEYGKKRAPPTNRVARE